MKRLWRLREVLMLPIKVLMVGVLMLGLSTLFNFQQSGSAQTWIVMVRELLSYIGYFLISIVPLVIAMNFVYQRNREGKAVILFIFIFFIFNVITMLFAPSNLMSQAYGSIFNLSITMPLSSGTMVPLNTGLIGPLAVAFVTNHVYRNYNRHAFGIFSFVDKDSLLFLVGLFFSFLLGLAFVIIWPLFIGIIEAIIRYVAVDIFDPTRLMVYGFTQKILSFLWLPNLIRDPFLFASEGGVWTNPDNLRVVGDVYMWTAQYDFGIVNLGVGRFITVDYLVNLFIVPGIVLAMYSRNSNKTSRTKQLPLLLLALLAVFLAGNPMPVELTLLVMAPMIFLIYIIIVGLLYLIPNLFSIFLGYSFTGSDIRLITPGRLIEYLGYGGDGAMQLNVYSIAIIGVLVAIILAVLVIYYFKNAGLKPARKKTLKIDIHGLIVALGGNVNIQNIDSSMSKISVQVENRGKVNIESLQQLGASAVVQTRQGYSIVFGSQSALIKDAMKEQLDKMSKEKK